MEMFTYIQQMFEITLQGEKQGIWFFASLYCFVLCGYSFWFQLGTRGWPTTRGNLAQSLLDTFEYNSVPSEQVYRAMATYTYSVDNVKYEGTKISPWVFVASYNARDVLKRQMNKIQMYSDGSVRVRYNPRNPKKSYLLAASKIGLSITLSIGLLPSFLYWLNYHT